MRDDRLSAQTAIPPGAPGSSPADRFSAIVFDFDGTLAALNIDFAAMRTGVRELIARYPIATDGIVQLHILEMIQEATQRIMRVDPRGAAAFSQSAYALIAGIEMDAASRGALFPRTEELLLELARRKIGIGVVTRNCRAAVLRTFPAIDRYCQAVLTRDDTDLIKPHPAHLRTALRALGASPREAAMVGDHPLDMQLGRDAGASPIGVLTGHATREALAAAGADLILPDITHLTTTAR